MTMIHILILAAVQGAAELLPVSSSAHVIVIGKLMGLDPTTPEMTLLLVMLHTGTMFVALEQTPFLGWHWDLASTYGGDNDGLRGINTGNPGYLAATGSTQTRSSPSRLNTGCGCT